MLTKDNIEQNKLSQTEMDVAQVYLFTNPALEEQRELVEKFQIDDK